MSKNMIRRISKLESIKKPLNVAEAPLDETVQLLKQYDVLLTEMRRLPIDVQTQRQKEANDQVLKWYVAGGNKLE